MAHRRPKTLTKNLRSEPIRRSIDVRVLVVDDERSIVDMLTSGLADHGFEVTPIYTTKEAWDFISRDTSICVILTDICMPDRSGISLAEELLWNREESVALEVVVMTGAATTDSAIDAVRIRAFDFIRKPFRIAHVAEIVQRAAESALQRRRRADAEAALRNQLQVSEQERQALAARLARLSGEAGTAVVVDEPAAAETARTLAAALHEGTVRDLVPAAAGNFDATGRYAFVLAQAADQLDDRTLLEFLLTLVARPDQARALADRLLATFRGYAEILAAPISELISRGGLARDQAVCIKAVNASAVRLLRSRMQDGLVLQDWDSLSAYAYASLASERVENFRTLYLDNRNRLLADDLQARGTVDFVAVHTRELIRRGLEVHATKLVLVHNHPSGDARPSRQDVAVTREIAAACATVDMTLTDHLIVGRNGITSLRAEGFL